MTLVEALELIGGVVIALAIFPVWSFYLALRVYLKAPHGHAARLWVIVFAIISVGDLAVAVIALNYELLHLFDYQLYPVGLGVALAVPVAIGGAIAGIAYLINYYRP